MADWPEYATLPGNLSLETFEDRQGAEKQTFILDTIESVGGSKAEAARRLDVSPQHLQYMLGESKSAKTKVTKEIMQKKGKN